jgi:argininosuccinate lyase
LHELPVAFWRALHPAFGDDVMQCFDAAVSVERRNAIGGTSSEQVQRQLQEAKRWLQRKSTMVPPSEFSVKSKTD